MSDSSDSDEYPRKIGLARLAKARSLSCDILNEVGSDARHGSNLISENVANVAETSSSSSWMTPQHSGQEKNVNLPNEITIIATEENRSDSADGSLFPKTSLSEATDNTKDTSGPNGNSKLSFLQRVHQRSFKKKKPGQESEPTMNSQSPSPDSSLNRLKVPNRSRSKSLSRLSNAFANVYNLSVSSSQAGQKGKNFLMSEEVETIQTMASCPSTSSSQPSGSSSEIPPLEPKKQNVCVNQPGRISRTPVKSPRICNKVVPISSLDKSLHSNPNKILPPRAASEHRGKSRINISAHSDNDGLKSQCSKSMLNLTHNKVHPQVLNDCQTSKKFRKNVISKHKRRKKRYALNSNGHVADYKITAADKLPRKETFTSSSTLDVSTDQINRPSSWYGYDQMPNTSIASSENVSSDEELAAKEKENNAKLLKQRSVSLGRLNDNFESPMTLVSSAAARRKNYLYGGLDSLLGTAELERYFPDRNVAIFIATWNMNGNEPPIDLEDFLLPEDMDRVPDIYVVGTQESHDDKSEWEFLRKIRIAYVQEHILRPRGPSLLASSSLEPGCCSLILICSPTRKSYRSEFRTTRRSSAT